MLGRAARAGAHLLTGGPGGQPPAPEPDGSLANWGGVERWTPAALEVPGSVEEVAAVVRAAADAGRRAKVLASLHSFTAIAATTGVAIHLGRLCRLLDVEPESGLVTVEAGITLGRLNRSIAAWGLALANMGDIDVQSLAGALATGTHGTGAAVGSLASQVVALQLVTADGSVVECSPDRDRELFEAARVGLGALGVVTAVTLQAVPAFNLRAVERVEPLDAVLATIDTDAAANDHFELYWVPHTDLARTKRNNRTSEGPRGLGRGRRFVDRVLLENVAFGAVCRLERRVPALVPHLAPVLATGGSRDVVDRSYRIFASPRRVRFVEMEYALPRAHLVEALTGLRALVSRERLPVAFPVEVRLAPAEDVWLSSSHGRDTAYVAVHQYRGMPWERYFALVEALMVDLGGRPHWGKRHTRTAADLSPEYPQWERWQDQRSRVDPGGLWANPYLDRVVGPVRPRAPLASPAGRGRGQTSGQG